MASVSTAAGQTCPDVLEASLSGEEAECTLLTEGTLRSALNNAGVDYRLYRWASTLEAPFESVYDEPPYNQIAVTLTLASEAESNAFWHAHYWLGLGWFETPYLARHESYGEFLVVPGRLAGTGSGVEDRVLMSNDAGGWSPIDARQMDHETAEGWANELKAFLPEEHYIGKGIHIDYTTLTAEAHVWRRDDANCCPSGGMLWFRLKLGPNRTFEVVEAHYRPVEPFR